MLSLTNIDDKIWSKELHFMMTRKVEELFGWHLIMAMPHSGKTLVTQYEIM